MHTSVTVPPDDRAGLDRQARYLLLLPPASLERLRVDREGQAIANAGDRHAGHQRHPASAPPDPKDVLARVPTHSPEPWRHVIRYYGRLLGLVGGWDGGETRAEP